MASVPSDFPCSKQSFVPVCSPYHRCRVEILEELHAWVAPLKATVQVVCFLSAVMLVLSCLLICFNPRDEIEMEVRTYIPRCLSRPEGGVHVPPYLFSPISSPPPKYMRQLLKTGVMTHDDIEAIRRLRASANAVTKGSVIDVDMLDPLKQEHQKSKFGYSRKRMNRISPTNIVA